MRGGFLRQANFYNRVLRKLLKAAELSMIRPYDLRHTSATLLLARDVNVSVVSDRLGHDSIELTLKHYAHALPDMQQWAADVVFDKLFGPGSHQVAPKGQLAEAGIRDGLALAS